MFLIDVAIRATLILLAALMATMALRRAAAATRHLAWTLAVVCVLVLPILMVAAPEWPILPGGRAKALPHRVSVGRFAPAAARSGDADSARDEHTTDGLDAVQIGVALWALGTCVLLVRMFTGIQAVRGLARHARPADARCRALLREAAAAAGVTSSIRLLVSRDIAMPMTWGDRRAVVLLPQGAGDWLDERVRVVLLHELAHIRRADWLTHVGARLAVACHWFNPLAWIALRAMTRERELACDDFVIARGAVAADYAQHLFEIARNDRPGAVWAIAPAMARRAELEGRLLAVLTPHHRESSHFAPPAIMLAAVAIAIAVAAAAPAAAPRSYERVPNRGLSSSGLEVAAGSLQEANRERSIRNALVMALDGGSDDVREHAAMALALRAEAEVVEPLLRALKDPSAQVREKAAMGLAFRRQPQIADALLEAARDVDSQVREKAVFALSVSGDPRAIAALTAAAQDPNEQVREKAVQGLAVRARHVPSTSRSSKHVE